MIVQCEVPATMSEDDELIWAREHALRKEEFTIRDWQGAWREYRSRKSYWLEHRWDANTALAWFDETESWFMDNMSIFPRELTGDERFGHIVQVPYETLHYSFVIRGIVESAAERLKRAWK